jgi:hypothetical protein
LVGRVDDCDVNGDTIEVDPLRVVFCRKIHRCIAFKHSASAIESDRILTLRYTTHRHIRLTVSSSFLNAKKAIKKGDVV